ncbi:hypothetical protein Tco_0555590 [Tanacetum coccineum]
MKALKQFQNVIKEKGLQLSQMRISKRLVPASTIVRPDPDALIPYIINEEVYHLIAKQLQEQMDKEELIKKDEEEARLLAISKPEVIKVVQEEAEKIGPDPRKIASAKVGEKFKKAQDAEHHVLKKEHTKKARKYLELRKHKFESYMWTINNKLKPKTITDIKIYPKTNPVVITVYRGTDGRNFNVHKPFAFSAFGRKILEELGIKSALPAPTPEQASSQSSRKKKKHMELETETKIPRLESNRTLNMSYLSTIWSSKEPKQDIFFTNEFGNARFSLKLKKLIVEHPYQEKLKSKKVKLKPLDMR